MRSNKREALHRIPAATAVAERHHRQQFTALEPLRKGAHNTWRNANCARRVARPFFFPMEATKKMKRITSARVGTLALTLVIAACGAEAPETDEAASADTVGSALKYGDTATVNWVPTSYWSTYTFAGTAGDSVQITLTPSTTLGDAYVSLKSDGTDGYSRTQRTKTGTAIKMLHTLEATGTWTIEIHNDKNKAADFSLKLEKVPAQSCTATPAAPVVTPTGGTAGSLFDGALLKGTATTFDALVKRMTPATYSFSTGEGKLLLRTRACNTVTGCAAWKMVPPTEYGVGPNLMSTWTPGLGSLRITDATNKIFTLNYVLNASTAYLVSMDWGSASPTSYLYSKALGAVGAVTFNAAPGVQTSFVQTGSVDFHATTGQQLITDSYFVRLTAVQRAVAATTAGQYTEGQVGYFQSLLTGGKIEVTANADNSDVALRW
jgi:hypothetical protein